MLQAGATQFLGDLGGRDQIGTDYSLVDIDFPSTSLNAAVGFRYRFAPHFATTSLLNFGLLRGSDAQTADRDRNARNLAFRSIVLNFNQRFEAAERRMDKMENKLDLILEKLNSRK